MTFTFSPFNLFFLLSLFSYLVSLFFTFSFSFSFSFQSLLSLLGLFLLLVFLPFLLVPSSTLFLASPSSSLIFFFFSSSSFPSSSWSLSYHSPSNSKPSFVFFCYHSLSLFCQPSTQVH